MRLAESPPGPAPVAADSPSAPQPQYPRKKLSAAPLTLRRRLTRSQGSSSENAPPASIRLPPPLRVPPPIYLPIPCRLTLSTKLTPLKLSSFERTWAGACGPVVLDRRAFACASVCSPAPAPHPRLVASRESPPSHIFGRKRHQERIHVALITFTQALHHDAPDGDQELECDGRVNARKRRQPGFGDFQQHRRVQ